MKNPEELLLYVSGELEADERAAVESRLDADPEARAYVREFMELEELATTLPSPRPAHSPIDDVTVAKGRGQTRILALVTVLTIGALAALLLVQFGTPTLPNTPAETGGTFVLLDAPPPPAISDVLIETRPLLASSEEVRNRRRVRSRPRATLLAHADETP